MQKPITIKLGGRVRTLRFDINAICGFDEQGQDIDDLLRKKTMTSMRFLLWALLITDSEDKGEQNTPRSIGAMMEIDKVGYYSEQITKLFEAVPKVESEQAPLA